MTPVLTALALMAQAAEPAAAEPESTMTTPDLASLVVLRQADQACDLFDLPRRALLEASIAQARDDQVRAGVDPVRLDEAERRIEAGGAPDCQGEAVANLAGAHAARVRALAAYSDISFPGVHRVWSVDRGAVLSIRASEARWRVSQRDGAGQAAFGVFERDGEMQLALAYNAQTRAARASLVLRDPHRQPYPIDFSAGGLLPAPDNDPAASWGGGLRAQTRISAAGRLDEAAAQRLAPAGGAPARGFIFPTDALQHMAALKPRESIGVEMHDAAGQITERLWFEVGALRAALAMQAVELIEAEPVSASTAPAL